MLLAMASFGAFILLLSGILVVNLLTALMASQVRQIGVMKAVGGSRAQIARIYFSQALFLGVAAILVGLPAGLRRRPRPLPGPGRVSEFRHRKLRRSGVGLPARCLDRPRRAPAGGGLPGVEGQRDLRSRSSGGFRRVSKHLRNERFRPGRGRARRDGPAGPARDPQQLPTAGPAGMDGRDALGGRPVLHGRAERPGVDDPHARRALPGQEVRPGRSRFGAM